VHIRAIVSGIALFASFSLTAQTPGPATTSNVDSCEVSATPAATLLLPYFEVDTTAPPGTGTTTLFTVTNNSRYPQIAHVTVWTDWAFPVLAFNVFLTGYDVQGINLYDVIVNGVVVPGTPAGTSINTPSSLTPSAPHTFSTPLSNTSNPNFVTSGTMNVSTTCAALPGQLPADLTAAVKSALTLGTGYNAGGVNCSGPVGFNNGNRAKGYVTIDVVSYCTAQFPSDAGYYTGPAAAILFDNVLSGDYEQIGPSPAAGGGGTGYDAEGGPMVHIHAVPEGGLSGASGGVPVATNLPFTFYDRFTPTGKRAVDRRQPLPSAWNARFIQGGPTGFATDLKIWREGITAGSPSCAVGSDLAFNSVMDFRAIRFDEHENSSGLGNPCGLLQPCLAAGPSLPATSRTASSSSVFPPNLGVDVGGWLYLDLSSGARHVIPGGAFCSPTLSAQRAGFGTCVGNLDPSLIGIGNGGSRATTQNWVISSMFGAVGANRLSVDFDAVALGNGCTPGASAGAVVGPLWHPSGVLICPNGAPPSACATGTIHPPVNP
jgi:hypothetical protein